jgi:hypothetical protein
MRFRRSTPFALVALLALSLIPATPTASAQTHRVTDRVVDQEFMPDTSFIVPINLSGNFSAQTFTAGVSGDLVAINLDVTGVGPYPLHVAIRSVGPNGAPTETILGETTLTGPSPWSAPPDRLITFPSPIALTAGVQYAIVLNYPGSQPMGPDFGNLAGYWALAFSTTFTGGLAWSSSFYDDTSWSMTVGPYHLFRTWVVPRAVAGPESKDACKRGGWRTLVDNNGEPFRNQGQCVSWVMTRRSN